MGGSPPGGTAWTGQVLFGAWQGKTPTGEKLHGLVAAGRSGGSNARPFQCALGANATGRGSALLPPCQRGSSMGRELRLVGLVILAAIAFSFFDTYNKRTAKPIPVPLPMADETKPEPPRTVRAIQIYRTASDQSSADTPPSPTPAPVDPIGVFPETATVALPETLRSSLPTTRPPPPTQKTADDFCERYHLHKRYTNNGKSWRCVK